MSLTYSIQHVSYDSCYYPPSAVRGQLHMWIQYSRRAGSVWRTDSARKREGAREREIALVYCSERGDGERESEGGRKKEVECDRPSPMIPWDLRDMSTSGCRLQVDGRHRLSPLFSLDFDVTTSLYL